MTELSERFLVDTSVWALFLRARGPAGLRTEVSRALDDGRVATCWVVKSELLIGARDIESFATLLDLLSAVPDIPITEEYWTSASQLGHRLRKQGLIVALPDLLIAQCAISAGCVLWHADSDFENIRRRTGLQTRHWRGSDH